MIIILVTAFTFQSTLRAENTITAYKTDLQAGSIIFPGNTPVPEAFKKQLSLVVDAYILLKDAFAADQESKATQAAKSTLDALKKVEMGLIRGEDHILWMNQYRAIMTNLNMIIDMPGLDMKRSHFSVVSENMTEAVKSFGIVSDKPVYLEFCPMANDNKGGYWLSNDKAIRNPYLGGKMPACGKVTETLNQ